MNLYSNFQYLQDHSTVNAEYLKRVELLQAQVEQLKQYHNPQKAESNLAPVERLRIVP